MIIQPGKISNMLPIKIHKKKYLEKITKSLFQSNDNENIDFDIVIILENGNISFRDFSAFLLVIDHFYGRTYKKGFLSYSLTDSVHLKADKIREGSIEIVIQEILKKLSIQNSFYFFLLIRYLPVALKSISEALLNTSESWVNIEKAKLTRIVRKNLRNEIQADEIMRSLDKDEILKLAKELQKKYDLDRRHVYKAARFSKEKMKEVKLLRKDLKKSRK